MRHLRMLTLLDRHRQTSKAAAVLNITQPAVSKALADVEAGLQIKLFDRHARGLTPTPAGVTVIRCARLVLATLADTGEELDALANNNMKPIRIGALPAAATSLIPFCLSHIKLAAPSTAVFIREASMDSLVSELRSGGIELIVGVLSDLQSYRDLEEEVLYNDNTVFVVRRGHELECQNKIDPARLSEYPWVMPPSQSLLGDGLADWFMNHGIPRPVNIVETLSYSVIRHYLSITDSIASIPSSVAIEKNWSQSFHILPFAPPELKRPVGMSWYRTRPETRELKLFKDCIRDVVRRHIDKTLIV